MKLITILTRLRPHRAPKPQRLDVTTSWSARDWADLPVHHPRAN